MITKAQRSLVVKRGHQLKKHLHSSQRQQYTISQNYQLTNRLFLSSADLISGNTAFLWQCDSKDSDKIIFHCTFRRVREAFYRIHTLKWSVGTPLNGVRE